MSSYDGRWGRHAGDWPAGDRADRGTEQWLTRWAVEDLVRQVEHTAFCFEVMPGEPKGRGDRKDLERYERGDLERLTKLMRSERSLLYVRSLVEAGKRVERVRVWDDPPTPFQAMRRWMATWNVAAGEVVRYLSHDRAAEVGLSPAVQACRWWLLDSCRVVRLDANPGRLLTSDPHQAVTDPAALVRACGWRDAAWHHSTPEVEDASEEQIRAAARMDVHLAEGLKPEVVDQAMGLLSERERKMVMMRLGIGTQPQTLRAIGEVFGVTGPRVQQIVWKARSRLNWQRTLIDLVIEMHEDRQSQYRPSQR